MLRQQPHHHPPMSTTSSSVTTSTITATTSSLASKSNANNTNGVENGHDYLPLHTHHIQQQKCIPLPASQNRRSRRGSRIKNNNNYYHQRYNDIRKQCNRFFQQITRIVHQVNISRNDIKQLILCLFGCIILLFIIIAYLIVLLLLQSKSIPSTTNVNTTTATTITSTTTTPITPLSALPNEHRFKFDTILQEVAANNNNQNPHILNNATYSRNSFNQNNNNTTTTTKNLSSTDQQLQIVWLMSFPNSGTSYTSQLVREMTQTFTASNYADETPEGKHGERIPVYNNETTGPFWTIPSPYKNIYTYPKKYVLTKTHCGIRCSLCSPNEYAETTYSFRRRCVVTKWVEYDTKSQQYYNVYSTYPISYVTKAVHIIRNPFDNVVSRFHLERSSSISSTSSTSSDRTTNHTIVKPQMQQYSPDRHGFLRYCLSIDFKYIQQEIKYMHFQENKVLQDLWLVPCHADFMRYIEWHNLAFITTNDLHLPTYVLHYDWYMTQFNTVIYDLFTFLQLPIISNPTPFIQGKVYSDYYTIDEQLIVKRAFEFMASSITWDHVQQYFPDG